MSDVASDTITRPANTASLSFLGLSALGVVFGDIGTSPLYTLKTVLGLTGGTPDAAATLGVLSLVVWTLIVEIAIFVPLILLGVGRLGAHLLSKVEEDEDAYFILMLAILAVAGTLATSITCPALSGAFSPDWRSMRRLRPGRQKKNWSSSGTRSSSRSFSW